MELALATSFDLGLVSLTKPSGNSGGTAGEDREEWHVIPELPPSVPPEDEYFK